MNTYRVTYSDGSTEDITADSFQQGYMKTDPFSFSVTFYEHQEALVGNNDPWDAGTPYVPKEPLGIVADVVRVMKLP